MMEGILGGLFIFVLAMFAGFEVITKVPPTLYTPLMSGTNAISGIVLLGALVMGGSDTWDSATWLGVLAIILAAVNVVGGFLVTDRMARMFTRSRDDV
jgi:NAD(P) transhydrogenase subunit alpha